MTGGTSGFGTYALEQLSADPGTTLLLGARGENRAVPNGVEILPLDLSSIESTSQFTAQVIDRLDGQQIDVLILNAGIHGSNADQLSADGYGLTFAVNHLAHYLIARRLLPYVADQGRLVITTSNMHDPPFQFLAPKQLDIGEWTFPSPGGPGTGTKAYCASKLCNMMTALTLARLPEVAARDLDIVAFNPGLTGGAAGNDARSVHKLAVTWVMRTLFPLIGLFRPEFNMNPPEHSGHMLAQVALGDIAPPGGSGYVSLVKGAPTFPQPSELARNIEAQNRLWHESAALVGLDKVIPRPFLRVSG